LTPIRSDRHTHGGIAPVKQLFAGSTQTDPPALVRSKFEAAFGRSLDAVEADWLAFLDARPPA
jgi:hypothetical protein